MIRPYKSRGSTAGIAIVAVLISAVVFLGVIIAITGTLSLSSRQSTGDQRVTLEAQYAAESGMSRVLAETQTGLMRQWSQLVFGVTTDDSTTVTDTENWARRFCNRSVGDPLTPVGTYSYCTVNPAFNASVADTQFDVFASNLTPGNYTDAGFSTAPTDERAFWVDAFSNGDLGTAGARYRYEQTISTGVTYRVGFGLEPMGVALVSGNYRFFFRVRDSTSVGSYTSGSRLISERRTTRSYPTQYVIELQPPSFARLLLATNRQTEPATNGNPGEAVYFSRDTLMDGPVFTNGQFNFTGNPWFADSVRSAGCVNGTIPNATPCPGATALYKDGSGSPLSVIATNDSDASFPGYAVGAPSTTTAPEFVRKNLNSDRITYTPGSKPAPWAYTGEYQSPTIELPTVATTQLSSAESSGMYIKRTPNPGTSNSRTRQFIDDGGPTQLEVFATRTPKSTSTTFAPINPGVTASGEVYQFIRLKLKQKLSNCRAVPATIGLTPIEMPKRPGEFQDYLIAVTGGQNDYSYEFAPTDRTATFARTDSTPVTGNLSNTTTTATRFNVDAGSPQSPGFTGGPPYNGTPVSITATFAGGVTRVAKLFVKPGVPVAPTLSVSPATHPFEGGNSTFSWPAPPDGVTYTLERTPTGVGFPLTIAAGSTGTTFKVDRPIVIPTNDAQATANRANVSYTYTIRATNGLGEAAVSSPQTVVVNGALKPGVTLISQPGTSSGNRLPVGGATVQLKWNLSGTYTDLAAYPFQYILIKPDGTQQDVTATSGTVGITTPVITNSATYDRYAIKVRGTAGVLDFNNAGSVDAGDYEDLFVNALQAPVINSFTKTVGGSPTANLPYVGGVANLQWDISGFNTTVTIDQVVGTQPGNGNTGNGVKTGSVNAPSTNLDKIYTIKASNGVGFDEKIITVSVDPLQKPTISDLSLDPVTTNNVVAGPTFKLKWAVSSDAPVTLSLKPINPSGSAIVVTGTTSLSNLPITENVTYELTATNAAGSSTRVIRVLITPPAPPIIDSLVANPASYPTATGNMRPNISWQITLPSNGPLTALTLTPLVTNSNVIASSVGGTPTVRTGSKAIDTPMTGTTDFTLTATNAGGTTSRVVRVPVGTGVTALPPLPIIVTFSAVPITPNTATTVGGGNNTISYDTDNGTSWTLTQNRPLATALPQPSSNSPSNFVRLIPETTSYTLTVSNAAGSVSRTIQVAVPFPPPPQITAFASSPNPIPFPGGTHSLSYSIANATASSIDNSVGSVQGTSSKSWTTTNETVYTLTASNDAGTVTRSITVTIDPQQAPTITSFTPASQTLPYGGGSGATLGWTVNTLSAGTPITTKITLVTAPSGVTTGGSVVVTPTSSTTSPPTMSGSNTVTPTVSGTYTYRIDSQNNIPQASAPKTVTVTVNPPSISIGTITASGNPFAFQNGSTTNTTISWTVTATPAPTSVTIARIQQPTGAPAASTTVTGTYPNYSSVQTVGVSGTYKYRITATNAAGSPAKDITVTVNNPTAPAITSFTATPDSLPASGTLGYTSGNSTLAWAIPSSSGPITSGKITRSSTADTSVTLTPNTTGSATVSGLGTPGTYTYTLTATGASGASPLTASLNKDITVRPVATLQNLAGGSTADRPEESPDTGSRAVNPGWTVTPEWSTPNTNDHPINSSRTYSVSVDQPGEAITNLQISSSQQVTFNVGQLPSGINQKVYTITAKLVVNGVTKTASWPVVVTRKKIGAGMRPRATLTQTACSAGGPVEYYWPVFVDMHIRNIGTEQAPNMQISTRTYGASGSVANPSDANWNGLPGITPVTWTPEISFNGVLYIDGQTVITGPPRVAAVRVAPNPQYYVQPAIASFAAMTFTSTTGMVIRNDITYQNPVCTIPPRRDAGTGIVTPATCEQDTTKWSRNVLGLYAPTGNIVIDSIAPNPSLQAITMASRGSIEVAGIREASSACPDGRNGTKNLLVDTSNQLGLVNIQGSLIQDTYGQFGKVTNGAVSCGYGRSMTFDRRMNDSTYVPPSFPRADNQVWTTRFFTFDNGAISAPILVTPTSTLPVRPGFSRIK